MPWIAAGGDVFVCVVLPVMAAIILGSWLYSRHRKEQRRQAMQVLATSLQMEFDPEGACLPWDRLQGLHLFTLGRNHRPANVLHGQTQGIAVFVFDYTYRVGGGKHSHDVEQTVAAFRLPKPAFPAMELREEGFWHKVGGMFGYQDIDFPSHPAFSDRYLVRGADEAVVRQFLQPDVLDYLQARPGWAIETVGDVLVLYRPAQRLPAAGVSPFLQEAWSMVFRLVTPRE